MNFNVTVWSKSLYLYIGLSLEFNLSFLFKFFWFWGATGDHNGFTVDRECCLSFSNCRSFSPFRAGHCAFTSDCIAFTIYCVLPVLFTIFSVVLFFHGSRKTPFQLLSSVFQLVFTPFHLCSYLFNLFSEKLQWSHQGRTKSLKKTIYSSGLHHRARKVCHSII